MMRSKPFYSNLLLIVANLLVPASILVFATGFFPYKPFLPGLAEYEALEYGVPPTGQFDKIIFMVVDALRSDFVYSQDSGFVYTQELIRNGGAIPYTANARSPTVTMPRIKSITTGSIPSFVDLILNIDEGDTSSSLAVQDTWLAQLKAKNTGKLLMYGDDTWLKLFPNTFDREDGTSSFFVSDFTEVDNNVTRNIAGELENMDWGLMVLHYLGLDHIGHKSGPRSTNMIPKQREMDGIVQTIFQALENKDHLKSTLFVVCGDHGMNDAGNHGASSPGETSPALLFMSPKMRDLGLRFPVPSEPKVEFEYYSKVEQSDLAPTIAALLGFPVPKNNLGAFIPDFLPFWSSASDQVQILVRNARQILQIVTAMFGPELFNDNNTTDPCKLEQTDVNELACEWRKISQQASIADKETELDRIWLESISNWLRKAQDLMSSMASNYDMSRLVLGQALAIVAVVASTLAVMNTANNNRTGLQQLALVAMPYGIMMFASSYVEEEHHFWYWSSTLWLAYLGMRNVRRERHFSALILPLIILSILRLARSWNQSGQKFAGEPDIVKIFLIQYPQVLWVLVIAAYTLVSFQLLSNFDGIPFFVSTGLAAILVTSAFAFKLSFTAEDSPELISGFAETLANVFKGQTLLFRARSVFALLAVAYMAAIYISLNDVPRAVRASANLIHHLTTVLLMTQSRATNIPLLLLSSILLEILFALPLSTSQITLTSILLQFTTFFAYGGTNAISSVDLSLSYNGISGFNVAAVGVLTLISNWAGPIFWTSATNLLLLERYRKGGKKVFVRHVALLTLFTTLSMAFVMAACTALRTHLFIWTVFSPKYLYCMAWSLGQHLLINIGFGGLLYWLGARGSRRR